MRHKSFVRVAGIVTGKQRRGTASSVMFISLGDETGTVEILTEKVSTPVVHVIADYIHDYSQVLQGLKLMSQKL